MTEEQISAALLSTALVIYMIFVIRCEIKLRKNGKLKNNRRKDRKDSGES